MILRSKNQIINTIIVVGKTKILIGESFKVIRTGNGIVVDSGKDM